MAELVGSRAEEDIAMASLATYSRATGESAVVGAASVSDRRDLNHTVLVVEEIEDSVAAASCRLLFDQLGVGEGTNYLDVACGSGLAANTAARRGASVSGLDASTALIDIARVRTPQGDFKVGDMFALPFDDGSFDVVTSFNGIWNGCDDALREVRRLLAPDGQLGMTFWGSYELGWVTARPS